MLRLLLLVPSCLCCGSVIANGAKTGRLVAPAPTEYPYRCEWNLSAAAYHGVRLRFESIRLPSANNRSGQCLDGHVSVVWVDRYNKWFSSPRFCGSSPPAPMEALQNRILVHYVLERQVDAGSGFELEYEFVPEEKMLLAESCPSEHRGHSGKLTSPNWPRPFPQNSSCEWLIRVTPPQLIFIQLFHIHLNPTSEECDRASLTIQDGYQFQTSREAFEGVRLCGPRSNYVEEGMQSFLSTSNRVIVRFRSSGYGVGEGRYGFHLGWSAVERVMEEGDAVGRAREEGEAPCSLSCPASICIEHIQGVCSTRASLCLNTSLACDGHPDCPFYDFSDEHGCSWRGIATAGAASSLLIASTILSAFCCEKRRRFHKANEHKTRT